jgi:hypothetical protein
MMIEEVVLEKLRALPPMQQQEVLDFVEFLESKVAARPVIPAATQKQLAAAAQALLADYESDTELTANE